MIQQKSRESANERPEGTPGERPPFSRSSLARRPSAGPFGANAAHQSVLELVPRSDYRLLMSWTIDQLAEEAMQLPSASRALLAERLVESLDFAEIDEIQKLWAAEAIRRRDEIRSGRVQPIPGEQVLAEVRRLVGR